MVLAASEPAGQRAEGRAHWARRCEPPVGRLLLLLLLPLLLLLLRVLLLLLLLLRRGA